jgi:hypothetical protein
MVLIFEIDIFDIFWKTRSSKSMTAKICEFSRLRQDVSPILVSFWENVEKADQQNHRQNIDLVRKIDRTSHHRMMVFEE